MTYIKWQELEQKNLQKIVDILRDVLYKGLISFFKQLQAGTKKRAF